MDFLQLLNKESYEVFNEFMFFNSELDWYYKQHYYLSIKGTGNILVCAHVDTVEDDTEYIKSFSINDGKLIATKGLGNYCPSIIGGDDRCGVWILYKILTETNLRPHIILFDGEEEWGTGVKEFCKTQILSKEIDTIIELDYQGYGTYVEYKKNSKSIYDLMGKHNIYYNGCGIFSDISVLGEYYPKIDMINMGVGFYNAHTEKEYIDVREMSKAYYTICNILKGE